MLDGRQISGAVQMILNSLECAVAGYEFELKYSVKGGRDNCTGQANIICKKGSSPAALAKPIDSFDLSFQYAVTRPDR